LGQCIPVCLINSSGGVVRINIKKNKISYKAMTSSRSLFEFDDEDEKEENES
jgi:hypothetical protein